jgi:hypothetical protein
MAQFITYPVTKPSTASKSKVKISSLIRLRPDEDVDFGSWSDP